ncbi:probable WRKY transcription factor 26 [Selaginella moellendorffii]|uniref:probable WRKY transcription factor 26 n=1 Tax=Selaginella moellendorffii TaxID=88036 RepID=UPI000D1C8C42|nr:probable WRKY transcription factor 26 [Selaginella moellendorffii]|eukprot:XP_024519592.1 probable WRKY transcription factor 26 [Selaginella moellendorffii]
MERGEGSGRGGLVVSKPVRPHLAVLPPRPSMEALLRSSDLSRSPMGVVANFLAEQDPDSSSISFTSLLQGALASPSPKILSRFKSSPLDSPLLLSSSALAEPSPTTGFHVVNPLAWHPPPSPLPLSPLGGVSHGQLLAQVQSHAQVLQQQQQQQKPADSNKQEEDDEHGEQQDEDTSVALVPAAPAVTRASASASTPAPEHDGYNWRKYGQKQVKGCDNPRSYYRCTHPDCSAKKLVERSVSGETTQIVYKGDHSHSKPQMIRRLAVTRVQPDDGSKRTLVLVPGGATPTPAQRHASNSNSSDVEEEEEEQEAEDGEEPDAKRRRRDGMNASSRSSGSGSREAPVVVHTNSEVDVLDDGYRWRKYGQKVVKGNPNPRSYYRCTNPGCPVRKHVERAADDPKAVITSYEGKHDHDTPAARGGAASTSTTSTKLLPAPLSA